MKAKSLIVTCIIVCFCTALLYLQFGTARNHNVIKHNQAASSRAKTLIKKEAVGKTSDHPRKTQQDLYIGDLQEKLEKYLDKQRGVYSIGFKDLDNCQEIIIDQGSAPSASIIKIYIMIEAYNQAKQGLNDLENEIALQPENMVGGTGSLSGKPVGTKISIKNLLELMITQSDNTAANSLIDLLGMDRINKTAKRLGCKDTKLQREMMDLASIKAGKDNSTSVSDLVLTLDKIYNGKCISPHNDEQMIEIMKRQQLNQMIPRFLPPETSVAHKTGSLTGINNDAAIVFTDHGDYILCVLSQKEANSCKAEDAIAEISKMVFDSFTAAK